MPKARVVAFRAWSHDELRDFRGAYGSHSTEELAEMFDRTPREIERKATSLALRKDKAWRRKIDGEGSTRMPRWDDEKVEHLRRHYATTPNLILALELGRSVKAVVSKAHQMRLHKAPERLRAMGQENVALRRDRENGRA
jgi:hypothetical protein